MKRICCINGALSQPEMLRELSHLGVGVFETARLCRRENNEGDQFYVLGLDAHLDRLSRGVLVLGLKSVNRNGLRMEIDLVARRASWGSSVDARMRVIVLRSDHIVSLEPFGAGYFQSCATGVEAVSFLGERSIPELKSCSALICYMAHQHALSSGAGEALLVDREGIVREGAWSNFFWIDEQGRLRTPASGMLPGITRRLVIDALGGKAIECDAPLTEILDRASEAFITQSTKGIVPLTSIDGKRLESTADSSVTRRLQAQLAQMLETVSEPIQSN